jgi:hypothetical protein
LTLVSAYARLVGVDFRVALPSPDRFSARLSIPMAETPVPQAPATQHSTTAQTASV